MRSFLSGLATLIAIAAIVVGLPSFWITDRVISPDGFADTASTVAADPQVQSYMADELTAQVVAATNGLAPAALVAPIAARYTASPQFQQDFVDIAMQQHSWLFNEATPAQRGQPMELDLTEMANRVIATAGVSVRIPGTITVPITRRAGAGLEAGRYYQVSQQISRIAYSSVVVAIVAALLALLVGRRRGTILAWLGVGTIVAAAVSWGAANLLSQRAKQEIAATSDGARQVAEITIDGAVADLTQVALIVGGVGAGMVVIGVIVTVAVRR